MTALTTSYLDSTSKRIKWFAFMDENPLNPSVMKKLEGKGNGLGTVIAVANNMVGNTFYAEAASIADGVVYGYNSTLAGSEVGQGFKSEAGYRSALRFAIKVEAIDETKTERDLVGSATDQLLPHWARTYDQMMVDALSVYSYAAATITGPATTAQLVYLCNPSHATNIAALNAILNLSGIGTSSVSSATYTGKNVYFAGCGGGTNPVTMPAVNTLNDALANPENYRIKTEDFAFMQDYAASRGMFQTYLANGNADFSSLIFLCPTPVLTELRQNDTKYQKTMVAGDISSAEMWSGKMRMDTIGGITIMPFNHNFPATVTGIKGGTVLRVQASSDDKWWVCECLLVGAQSGVVCNYKNGNAQIVRRTDTDYENFVGIGYRVVTGAQKRHRLVVPDDTTNYLYDNVCSVICTYRKWN